MAESIGRVAIRASRVKSMPALFTLVALVLGLQVVLAPAASAAHGFTVNSTDDQVDATPGDGSCATSDVGDIPECTLRAAIQEANAHAGDDTISVPAGTYLRSIAEESPWENGSASGDLDIASDVTIQGAGRETTIIDAEKRGPVLHVVSGTLALKDLTVTDGYTPHAHGAGIRVETTAHLVNVDVEANELAIRAGGGGIANFGTLTVAGGSISDNISAGEGGGLSTTALRRHSTAFPSGTTGPTMAEGGRSSAGRDP